MPLEQRRGQACTQGKIGGGGRRHGRRGLGGGKKNFGVEMKLVWLRVAFNYRSVICRHASVASTHAPAIIFVSDEKLTSVRRFAAQEKWLESAICHGDPVPWPGRDEHRRRALRKGPGRSGEAVQASARRWHSVYAGLRKDVYGKLMICEHGNDRTPISCVSQVRTTS